MGNENNSSNAQNERINENDTKHATHISESVSDKLYNSIVRIEKEDDIGTGFFLKVNIKEKIKYFLFTCCHVLNQADIDSKKTISLFYGKKAEEKEILIKLDDTERFIICFPGEKDVTVIEILEKDGIPQNKYLMPDLNYKYGYEIYKDRKFILAGYPSDEIYQKERHIASGEIKDIIGFEFKHTLDTRSGSSGSPICLVNNIQVIGIHKAGEKRKPFNYGTFIGIIIDELERNYKEVMIEENNIEDNIEDYIEDNIEDNHNNYIMLLKDFSQKDNLAYQKKLLYFLKNQNKDNYLKALYELQTFDYRPYVEIKEKDIPKFLQNLKIYENVNQDYQKIIRNYKEVSGIWKFMHYILRGKNKLLFQKFIYFLAGFIKSLNIIEANIVNYNCELYYGTHINYDDLMGFKNNINEVICFKSFFSSSSDRWMAEKFCQVLKENKIGTLIIIKYEYNENCLPDCYDISDLSCYPDEKERLFKAFSFFKIIEVQIYEYNKKAEIVLNYIGKERDFEAKLEKYNNSNNIRYNNNRNMIEII